MDSEFARQAASCVSTLTAHTSTLSELEPGTGSKKSPVRSSHSPPTAQYSWGKLEHPAQAIAPTNPRSFGYVFQLMHYSSPTARQHAGPSAQREVQERIGNELFAFSNWMGGQNPNPEGFFGKSGQIKANSTASEDADPRIALLIYTELQAPNNQAQMRKSAEIPTIASSQR